MGRSTVPDSKGLPDAPRWGHRRHLIAIGFIYLLAQVLLFSPDRAVSWDEAIYLSQVTPGVTALPFAASRSRGVVLLVAPLSMSGAGLPVIRLILACLSSAALIASFSVWIPRLGALAVGAAALFASTWLSLLYGSEVMPNLWSALAVVAALGLLTSRPLSRNQLLLGTLLLGIVALLRPVEAVLLASMVMLWIGWRLVPLVTVALGVAAGLAPWLIEVSIRSGGIAEALSASATVGHVSRLGVDGVLRHLALTDGPTIGTAAHPNPALSGVVWWACWLVAASVGIACARDAVRRRALLVCGVSALAFFGFYVLLVSGYAPRFLLPTYGLTAFPVAAGVASMSMRSSILRVGVLVVFGALLSWHVLTAERIEAELVESRGAAASVGVRVMAVSRTDDCRFASTDAFPQVQFASGCIGRSTRSAGVSSWLSAAEESFVIARTSDLPSFCEFGSTEEIRVPFGTSWYVSTCESTRSAVTSGHADNAR